MNPCQGLPLAGVGGPWAMAHTGVRRSVFAEGLLKDGPWTVQYNVCPMVGRLKAKVNALEYEGLAAG